MCRSIKQLRRPEPADETEIRDAAVAEVADSTRRLLEAVSPER